MNLPVWVRRLLVSVLVPAMLAGCRAMSPIGAIPSATAMPMGAAAKPDDDLREPPVVQAKGGVAKVDLVVAMDFFTHFPTFVYNGLYNVAPTINIRPGDTIVVNLYNALPNASPPEPMQMPGDQMQPAPAPTSMELDANLHFHGLNVSPKAPSDDVLTMLALPGGKLRYVVHVPATQEPGLYWYHTHVHGETSYQVGQAGMSGAIIVEGIEKHIPALARMKQRLLIVRDTGKGTDSARPDVPNPDPCGEDPGLVTVDNVLRPVIRIAPGERQFFRLVNATGHKTLKLRVPGEQLEVVAIDGFALDSFPGTPPTMKEESIIVPPAARAEFVVTGPANGSAKFKSLCYNSGPDGDRDPEVELGVLQAPPGALRPYPPGPALTVGEPLPANGYTSPLPPIAAKRLVVFSEGPKHFFINGKTFRPNAPPMFLVHVGTVEQWHIVNVTDEIHDFHIHQVHFYVEYINGVKVAHPYWADSVVLPHRLSKHKNSKPGSIIAIMDFRDPVIKGTFLFHCHFLDHEDKGMMAKIQAI